MRVIVAGPRSFNNYDAVVEAIEEAPFTITHLFTGGARGVDSLAEQWAEANDVQITTITPDYDKYPDKLAPLKRNEKLARKAEALIAVWNGVSGGTKDMIQTADDAGLPIHRHAVDGMTTLSDWG